MDERQLKELLSGDDAPAPTDAAREQAIARALDAYDAAQRSGQTGAQGSSLFDRLKDRFRNLSRRRLMTRDLAFGGVAATAVVLIALVTYNTYAPLPGSQNASVAQEHAKTEQRLNAMSGVRDKAKAKPAAPGMAAPPPLAGYSAQRPIGQSGSGYQSQRTVQEKSFARRAASPGSLARPAPARSDAAVLPPREVGRDQFEGVEQNPVHLVSADPVSTFSIDVDTASYAFVRRMLNRGVLPQKDAVRVEEMVNYFPYDYPAPETRAVPFRPTVRVMPCPWKPGDKLVHIGIKGYALEPAEKPRSNLVFLLDVSGSMNAPDKLPLMINSMRLLLDTLRPDDTVGIVVYAGAAGTVLEPTKVSEKSKILAALDRLRSGGSTAGGEGLRQAYALAESNFDAKAVNRVILATDGDFNVGITDRNELKGFIERKRKTGIFLSVLGFGQGNMNDRLMQTLAQNGNGTAAYIDTLNEARKVLVEEASSTLFPIARDVKIQVEFNPRTVSEYRLIGYETRALKREDFRNDKVDAGDIGAGHTVTAIYEITPAGSDSGLLGESRYKPAESAKAAGSSDEYAFLKIRYKLPQDTRSKLITTPITTADETDNLQAPGLTEMRWAAAVAAFGQLLKGGTYTGDFSYDDVIALAQTARGRDEFGYRAEFINLVRLARSAAALPKN